MSGVIHIDIVPQMTVVKDKRSLGECRPFIPENVYVAHPVCRPYIELGSVSRCGFQRPPLTHQRLSEQSSVPLMRRESIERGDLHRLTGGIDNLQPPALPLVRVQGEIEVVARRHREAGRGCVRRADREVNFNEALGCRHLAIGRSDHG
jgi:hypothetical protein